LIIIVVLSGYGYSHILSRQDILLKKMKAEVRSTGRTLKVALERIPPPFQPEYVQGLADAVGDYERTVGVVIYYPGQDKLFRSASLSDDVGPYIKLIERSMHKDTGLEQFTVYKKEPLFSYTFPLKNKRGKAVGGVSILQHTSYEQGEMERAQWSIFITILVLIGGTVTLILWGTRRWVGRPISRLMEGIGGMAQGNLNTRIHLAGKDELGELARSFNQMAADLKNAQERIIREAEARLELERGLRQSEKLATVGQLASEIAHEIGTPLNIILGRTEMIEKQIDDRQTIRKNLDIIGNQIRKITKTIQQLLGFVRKEKSEQQHVDVNGLLKGTVELLNYQMEKQKLQVAIDLGDGLLPVACDPDQLQQVFFNLIVNALQAMPDGGTLLLRTADRVIAKPGSLDGERRYLEVCVEDSGPGMEKEVIRNIFRPFYTTKKTGTGLGLMVVKGIVEDHEGWITIESEVGKGSTFKVYLNTEKGLGDDDERGQ
jgi:signal transduction histidine kinase